VLVCDDSPLAREAMRRAVATVPDVASVGVVASGEEVLARWPLERPDVVMMDVGMPGMGGLEATRRLLGLHPEAAVIMVSTGEDYESVAKALGLGARGYVLKHASTQEIVAAVLHAASEPGGQKRRPVGRRGPVAGTVPKLTERELQVLTGMSQGRSNGEIGRDLFLSEDTVKTHARRLFRKLGAADRAQAVAVGYRCGLVR
jgi:DNA-binding NarL/FixJ family response regulator